ncbi:hypothetical protein [Micromonospora chalcea]|uniref:hypothetical protein n=1 Tax=Micromonospora chalcea TaxID=1874 RepID=UPI00157CCF3B|nr:hypothetical protein [Micromonospora chalcea]
MAQPGFVVGGQHGPGRCVPGETVQQRPPDAGGRLPARTGRHRGAAGAGPHGGQVRAEHDRDIGTSGRQLAHLGRRERRHVAGVDVDVLA